MAKEIAVKEPVAAQAEGKHLMLQLAEKYGLREEEFKSTVRKTCGLPTASAEEFAAFCMVCQTYNLNPILREIYAFPKKGGGIVPIVGIDGWVHLVNEQDTCDGFTFDDVHDEAGKLVSITCSMYRKDRKHPAQVTEYLEECARSTEPWKMQHRMLRHKALMQAARYVFGFAGIYDEDEGRKIADSATQLNDAPPDSSAPKDAAGQAVQADSKTGEVIDAEFTEATDDAASARRREEEQPDDDIPDTAATKTVRRIEPYEMATKEADGKTPIKIGIWVENYLAAVETSTSSGDVLRWGDFNRSILDFVRGRNASKESWDRIDSQMLRLMKALPDGADPKKAAAITAAAKAKDAAKKADKISTGTKPTAEKAGTVKQSIIPPSEHEYGEAPTDPEEWFKWIETVLATVTSPHDLEGVWNNIVGPSYTSAFPPDQTEAVKIYDRHEKRLGID